MAVARSPNTFPLRSYLSRLCSRRGRAAGCQRMGSRCTLGHFQPLWGMEPDAADRRYPTRELHNARQQQLVFEVAPRLMAISRAAVPATVRGQMSSRSSFDDKAITPAVALCGSEDDAEPVPLKIKFQTSSISSVPESSRVRM